MTNTQLFSHPSLNKIITRKKKNETKKKFFFYLLKQIKELKKKNTKIFPYPQHTELTRKN